MSVLAFSTNNIKTDSNCVTTTLGPRNKTEITLSRAFPRRQPSLHSTSASSDNVLILIDSSIVVRIKLLFIFNTRSPVIPLPAHRLAIH